MSAARRELVAFRAAQVCAIEVVRRSPVGDFYAPDPVKKGIAYAFEYEVVGDDLRAAQVEGAASVKPADPSLPPVKPKLPVPEHLGR